MGRVKTKTVTDLYWHIIITVGAKNSLQSKTWDMAHQGRRVLTKAFKCEAPPKGGAVSSEEPLSCCWTEKWATKPG